MKKLKTFLALASLTVATATFAQVQKIANLQITGGSPGAGKVLVSDANGNASWKTAAQAGLYGPGETVNVTTVVPVTSSTGKIWMDRNLGASRVAQSSDDYLAYGSLYQWGRGNDGHQLINWTSANTGTGVNGITATQSTTDTPGNSLFITKQDGNFNWRLTQNDNLWQGVAGVNNPCPAGYRLPTDAEFTSEITAYGITNIATAFASPFKFTFTGYRSLSNGAVISAGADSNYWSSTVFGTDARYRYLISTFTDSGVNYRAYGMAVRCIKN